MRFLHHNLDALLRRYFVENAITADQDEVGFISHLEDVNLWLADDALRIATVLFHFCNAVTECARDL